MPSFIKFRKPKTNRARGATDSASGFECLAWNIQCKVDSCLSGQMTPEGCGFESRRARSHKGHETKPASPSGLQPRAAIHFVGLSMRNICLSAIALVFAFLTANIFAQTQVFVSNATYGGQISVLVYENGNLASGSVEAISPSNATYYSPLVYGQAQFNASEAGNWAIEYNGQKYGSYVDDAAGAFGAHAQSVLADQGTSQQPDIAFYLALLLSLAIGCVLVFIYFFLVSYAGRHFGAKAGESGAGAQGAKTPHGLGKKTGSNIVGAKRKLKRKI